MTLASALAVVLSGGSVGFVLSLVGGGGSVLATPLLMYVAGVADTHVAIGTSAFAVSVNAYANLLAHARRGHVRWRCALAFAASGAAGALAGSSLGLRVDGGRLLFLFGAVMALVGMAMLRGAGARPASERPAGLAVCLATFAAGLGVGVAAGFFGIGGGFLVVPALIAATGMPMISAIGSSLMAVGTFGLTTALTYARAGMIDWPLAAQFIAGGVAGGIAGTLAATRLAARRDLLGRILGILILIVAAGVMIENLP